VRRKVELQRAIQEALSRVAVPENVEMLLQLDAACPIILADPRQLEQVFDNLILNAVQAMTLSSSVVTPGGGRLRVSSQVSTPGWMEVSFGDTGEGIPQENLDKLFEPLFTTKAQGIGLGLAIVKTMVEGHGGQIEVQSQVGQGSAFTVSLPQGGRPTAPPAEEQTA
jgi:signal transduction histidine kinase